jgi:hypothetical protein
MGWAIVILQFNSQQGLGIFLFTTTSRLTLGPTQPPIQWVLGTLSLRVKQPGHEADHSPPLMLRSRTHGAIPAILQYIFMTWCLVKHRVNFTFIFYLVFYSCMGVKLLLSCREEHRFCLRTNYLGRYLYLVKGKF